MAKNESSKPILTLNYGKKQDIPIKDTSSSLKTTDTTGKTSVNITKKNKSSKTEPAASEAKALPKAEYDFNAIYDELHAKFPTIINIEKPVLLAIAIRRIMLKEIKDVPNSVLHKWIGWYFHKSNYYTLHNVGAMRYNLDGSEAGVVTKKDQAKREKQLARMNNNNCNKNN